MDRKLNYISLFSGAGIGCYGFKQSGFECIATSEILEKRINIQRYNNKCKYQSGYICGDISLDENKAKILKEIEKWKLNDIDVILATPPCQGMSVANHKKKNEKYRNSLVVSSVDLVSKIKPKYFIFENVRSFLTTICTDQKGNDTIIGNMIDENLLGSYNILRRIINFKDYGNNSSRTRTLVIGVRRDIKDITPYDIFPKKRNSKALKDVIGNYASLSEMGEIDDKNIYHYFREYDKRMLPWVENTPEGKSAFDNDNARHRPHKVINNEIIPNKNKNGDKYKRCSWDAVAPCIHTRSDILASQSTIHPTNNRVFSISELMDLMTIPKNFKWTNKPLKELNSLSKSEKKNFLKKEDINIRQSIGESVPTAVFRNIAENIKSLESQIFNLNKINLIIKEYNLDKNFDALKSFIINNLDNMSYQNICHIIEYSNPNRETNSAYYTPQNICYSIVDMLPEINKDEVRILEPSVGSGNFIPLIIEKYRDKKVVLDVLDIDQNILSLLKIMTKKLDLKNVKINFIKKDFLTLNSSNKYDVLVGNPPFGNLNKLYIDKLQWKPFNNKTKNIFALFIEKSLKLANNIALITPKSLLSAPQYNLTRSILEKKIQGIVDYGESAFNGVKIETISILLENNKLKKRQPYIKVKSYITDSYFNIKKDDAFDKDINSWLIYKDDFFNMVKDTLILSVYDFYRDRAITKKDTKESGKIRVLKSRNIQNNKIIDINGYDSFMEDINHLPTKKYLNTFSVLVPNLSYNTRACFLPNDSIADGSVAILQPKNGFCITEEDLSYYSTDEFKRFYSIGRNLGTRSLNIDSNSINIWGIKKDRHLDEHK